MMFILCVTIYEISGSLITNMEAEEKGTYDNIAYIILTMIAPLAISIGAVAIIIVVLKAEKQNESVT